jgi:glycosyltransferase involved in cell wall biosynthesis
VEAFGMVALEAMASGVPVVSAPAPGPQFVLGGSGYYYTRREPEDVAAALERADRDRASGAILERIEHARVRAVREFSVAALAARLDDLFFRVQ